MSGMYLPLDSKKREVRLLKVKHDQRRSSNRCLLNLEMTTHSLTSAPPLIYKALSYCWGTDAASQKIEINGKLFYVRPNLESFLIRFQKQQSRIGSRDLIFIDAICINQEDVKEKEHQVALMGDIYHGANEVIAWLGDHDETGAAEKRYDRSDFHMDFELWQSMLDQEYMWLVAGAASRLGSPGKHARDRQQDLLNQFDRSEHGAHTLRLMVGPLVENAFWSRVWTVQEIILARRLIFWYDALHVDWYVLYECLMIGNNDFNTLRDEIPAYLLATILPKQKESATDKAQTRALELLKRKVEYAEKARRRKVTLSTAITSFAERDCSITRDRVYAMLGLTSSVVPVSYDPERGDHTLYLLALVEGLLEISYLNEEDTKKRSEESSAFAVILARSLGMNIHDPECQDQTAFCFKQVGLSFKRVGTLSAAQGLDSGHFRKFGGSVGYALSKKIPALKHRAATARNAFYNAKFWNLLPGTKDEGEIKEMEEGIRCFFSYFYTKRYFERWQYNDLVKVIPDIPTLTTERAEKIVDAIEKFAKIAWSSGTQSKVGKLGQSLGQMTVQCIEQHIATLKQSHDSFDQDHLQKLTNYKQRLQAWISTEDPCSDEEEEQRHDKSQDQGSGWEPQRDQDIICLACFLEDPNLRKRLDKLFLPDDYGNNKQRHMLEFFMSEAVLRYTSEIARLSSQRLPWDLIEVGQKYRGLYYAVLYQERYGKELLGTPKLDQEAIDQVISWGKTQEELAKLELALEVTITCREE